MNPDDYSGNFGQNTGYSANVSFGGPESNSQSATTVKDISTAEFRTEVMEASAQTPVLVDFWAPWCGPCKQLAPALESAVAATRGKVKLVKMNIDEHPEIAGQLGVQSIPAVFAFVGGRPVDAFTGAKNEGEIREFIAKIAGDGGPSQIDLMMEKAAELIEEGNLELAVQIYTQILSVEPENLSAIAAMGQLFLQADEIEKAETLLANLDEDHKSNTEIAGLASALELAKQAAALGDTSELAKEVENEPENHAKRLELAIALNAAGEREEATNHLLEIVKNAPEWNEGAAKSQLLQFFEAWGMADPSTVAARRKLSSLLFS